MHRYKCGVGSLEITCTSVLAMLISNSRFELCRQTLSTMDWQSFGYHYNNVISKLEVWDTLGLYNINNVNTSNLKSRHYFDPLWIKIWWFYDKIIYIFIFIDLFCKIWHQGWYQKFIQCEFRNLCLSIGAFSKFTNYVSITQNVNAQYGCFCCPN